MRVHHQLAYVLLNRPYSETSWIVEIFSKEYGRLALMAKGARRIKSHLKGVLIPFQPVLLSWVGKGEVPTLTSAEIQNSEINLFEHELSGDQLVCGFYCNELIVYLLHRNDPHKNLFKHYHQTILDLHKSSSIVDQPRSDITLRQFERMVVKEVGYGVNFKFEVDGKTPIRAECHYQFQGGQGFIRVRSNQANGHPGQTILDLDFENTCADISSSKYLMRDILNQTLGNKKIHSRELFFRGRTDLDKSKG